MWPSVALRIVPLHKRPVHISVCIPDVCWFGSPTEWALCILTFMGTTLESSSQSGSSMLGFFVLGIFGGFNIELPHAPDLLSAHFCVRLKMYVHTPFEDIKVFMKAEGRKANSVRWVFLFLLFFFSFSSKDDWTVILSRRFFWKYCSLFDIVAFLDFSSQFLFIN